MLIVQEMISIVEWLEYNYVFFHDFNSVSIGRLKAQLRREETMKLQMMNNYLHPLQRETSHSSRTEKMP